MNTSSPEHIDLSGINSSQIEIDPSQGNLLVVDSSGGSEPGDSAFQLTQQTVHRVLNPESSLVHGVPAMLQLCAQFDDVILISTAWSTCDMEIDPSVLDTVNDANSLSADPDGAAIAFFKQVVNYLLNTMNRLKDRKHKAFVGVLALSKAMPDRMINVLEWTTTFTTQNDLLCTIPLHADGILTHSGNSIASLVTICLTGHLEDQKLDTEDVKNLDTKTAKCIASALYLLAKTNAAEAIEAIAQILLISGHNDNNDNNHNATENNESKEEKKGGDAIQDNSNVDDNSNSNVDDSNNESAGTNQDSATDAPTCDNISSSSSSSSSFPKCLEWLKMSVNFAVIIACMVKNENTLLALYNGFGSSSSSSSSASSSGFIDPNFAHGYALNSAASSWLNGVKILVEKCGFDPAQHEAEAYYIALQRSKTDICKYFCHKILEQDNNKNNDTHGDNNDDESLLSDIDQKHEEIITAKFRPCPARFPIRIAIGFKPTFELAVSGETIFFNDLIALENFILRNSVPAIRQNHENYRSGGRYFFCPIECDIKHAGPKSGQLHDDLDASCGIGDIKYDTQDELKSIMQHRLGPIMAHIFRMPDYVYDRLWAFRNKKYVMLLLIQFSNNEMHVAVRATDDLTKFQE